MTKILKVDKNIISLVQRQFNYNVFYLIGVYLIKQLQPEDLISKIISQPVESYDICKDKIQQEIQIQNIEQIKVIKNFTRFP
jgi:hypothetical protein